MAERWYTIIEAVDIDTGELIGINVKKEKYIEINKTITYTVENGSNLKKITKEYKRNNQLELEFE